VTASIATGRRTFAAAFLSPGLILYSVFVFLPIAGSIYYSLTNWRIGRPVSFIGIRNYIDLFRDPQYWIVASNSFSLLLLAVFVQVPLALIIAYCLHLIGRGFRFYRSVLFLPVVIAPAAIGLLFSIFLNGDVGAFNAILKAIGLSEIARSWLSDSKLVIWAVNLTNVWQYLGLFVIIFVAAIRGIPQELFEAAAIDGASKPQMLPYIVVPMIREVTVICVILTSTGAIRAFDHSWIMTQGGPGQASSYFATLIYKRGFLDGQFGYACAMSVTLLIYVLLLVVVVQRVLLGRAR
jgi:raffinose/stachyose/melibiose transport system permease protein